LSSGSTRVSEPGKFVAIGFFRDEEAVTAWRTSTEHRRAQEARPDMVLHRLPVADGRGDPRTTAVWTAPKLQPIANATTTMGSMMYDLTIELDNRPGALAAMGEALGTAGVSIEGGAMFVVNGRAVAHFLFADGEAARAAIEAAGITVTAVRTPLVQRLDQQAAGQLGAITRLMAEAGVNIEVLYSDHDNQLILLVNRPEAGAAVSETWTRQRG
jgi:hypothetical protein